MGREQGLTGAHATRPYAQTQHYPASGILCAPVNTCLEFRVYAAIKCRWRPPEGGTPNGVNQTQSEAALKAELRTALIRQRLVGPSVSANAFRGRPNRCWKRKLRCTSADRPVCNQG